jgi:hypothetical protein
MFLKKSVRLSKFIPLRLVFAIARESYLLEDLKLKMLLLSVIVYREVMDGRRGKEKEIWEKFYRMTAVMKRKWIGSNYELGHVVTRAAVHGFHHRICRRQYYHVLDDKYMRCL